MKEKNFDSITLIDDIINSLAYEDNNYTDSFFPVRKDDKMIATHSYQPDKMTRWSWNSSLLTTNIYKIKVMSGFVAQVILKTSESAHDTKSQI